ncbi:MAG: delta-60 repeat domain-containing protein, partial [Bacteroidetes bacterium]|nr:delta-60 repeat domain-containing protein [Bacteroidota bacterium]
MKAAFIPMLCILTLDIQAQSPGTLDTSFNGNGMVILQPGLITNNVYDMAVTADQRILLCGVTSLTGDYSSDIAVGRLNQDGSIDSTFGINGWYKKDFFGLNDFANTMYILPDHRILVGGAVSVTVSNVAFMIMRLTEDGQTDTSFGNGLGYVITDINTERDYINDITVQPDGKIVVAGRTQKPGTNFERGALVRLYANGDMDSTFSQDGMVIFHLFTESTTVLYAVEILPDGKIIAAGYSGDIISLYRMLVVRFLSNGVVDTAFGVNGYYLGPQGVIERACDMIFQPPNRIIAAGYHLNAGMTQFLLLGLDTTGVPDPGFGV